MHRSYPFKSVTRILPALLCAFTLGAALAGCDSGDLSGRRNSHLEKLPMGEPVKVAVVWSSLYGDSYYQGVELALEELNAAGGVAGHPIRPVLIDEFKNLEEARLAVYPLSEDMDVAFSLGFYKSEMACSLMQLMQYYGVPVLTNANADEIVKKQWTGGVFRGTVTTSDFGRILYEECIRQGAESVILCYSSETYTSSIASAMISLFRENSSVEAQIYRIDALTNEWRGKLKEAVDTEKFRGRKTAAAVLMNDLDLVKRLFSMLVKEGDVDMAFATQMGFDVDFSAAEELSRRLKIPLFLTVDMVEASLKKIESQAAPGSIIRRYKKEHGRLPNEMLLYGYEQTMAVSNAMKKAGSAAPAKVVKALHALSYEGLMQTYEFTRSGELRYPRFFMITVRDGRVSVSKRGEGSTEAGGDG